MTQWLMENFELILTLAVLLCFIFYVLDGRSYRKERTRLLKVFLAGKETDDDRNRYSDRLMAAYNHGIRKKHKTLFSGTQTAINLRAPLNKAQLFWAQRPVYPRERFYEFFGGMFWVLFIVWSLRSFIAEPFQIPSASMEPTLQNGDFILTNKYAYGIRLPVLHTKILSTGEVKRGDVAVFRFPKNPKINYIKRIVGVPGDVIRYDQGRISVNGKEVALTPLNKIHQGHDDHRDYVVFEEALPDHAHQVQFVQDRRYANRMRGEVTVPEGQYFAMGDNRDNSEDGRFWGFVPDENLVGRALFIWMNSDCVTGKGFCDRIGNTIQ